MTSPNSKRPMSIPLNALCVTVPVWRVDFKRITNDPSKAHLCVVTLEFNFGGIAICGKVEYPMRDVDKLCPTRENVLVTIQNTPRGLELTEVWLNGKENVKVFQ